MPETPYTPPQTKYEVHIDEFMKAIKGEPFKEGNGLYRMAGREIWQKGLLAKRYYNNNQDYVLLIESRLIGADVIQLENRKVVDYGVGLVIVQSIVPNIFLSNTKIALLHFYNSQSGDILIWKNSQLGHIHIKENSQSGNIHIDYHSQSGDIRIGENSQSGNIHINYHSQSGHIRIWDHSQSGYIDIGGNSQSGDIGIWNKSQSDDIRIWENSQLGDIGIWNNSKPVAITIERNSQTGNLNFTDAQLSSIRVEDNYFGIRLYNTQFLITQLIRCLLTYLDWGVGTKGELYTSGQTRILHLKLTHASLLKDSLLSLSDASIQYAILEELQVQGYFLMRQVSAPREYPFLWRDIGAYMREGSQDNWRPQHWQSQKKLLEWQKGRYNRKLTELQQLYGNNPVFLISHSSLGKTEITGSNLAGYRFKYLNSKLLDCFITGTELPKDKIEIYNPIPNTDINDKDWYEQKVSIYNQFKKIYENQGDVVEASWYHAKAMDNQQSLLRLTYQQKVAPWHKKIFSEERFNLFGFWLNKISNNHSESWRVALRFILIISVVMYSLYYISIHCHEPLGFTKTGRFFGDYFGFLDITHRIDFHVPKEQLSPWSKLFDFFGRILIGYGFFQFIAAFRRHGKKGS